MIQDLADMIRYFYLVNSVNSMKKSFNKIASKFKGVLSMSKRISLFVFSVLVLFVFVYVHPSESQDEVNIKEHLLTDIVQVKDGKFVIEEYRICQIRRPEEFGGGATVPIKVKRHVEAPAKGVISRDNFIRISTEVLNSLGTTFVGQMIEGITAEQAQTALVCKQFFQPIGAYDYEVDLIMDANGLNLNILETTTKEKVQQSMSWDQSTQDPGQPK